MENKSELKSALTNLMNALYESNDASLGSLVMMAIDYIEELEDELKPSLSKLRRKQIELLKAEQDVKALREEIYKLENDDTVQQQRQYEISEFEENYIEEQWHGEDEEDYE